MERHGRAGAPAHDEGLGHGHLVITPSYPCQVRLLTTEAKTEETASLSEALASISTSIINDIPEVHRAAPGAAPGDAPEAAPGVAPGVAPAGAVPAAGDVPGSLAASPAPQDPLGRPVTCGVLCFDEVQVRC